MFIGKLDNIVDKCNNTYRTIKIKPTDVKVSILTWMLRIKILNLKFVIMREEVFVVEKS